MSEDEFLALVTAGQPAAPDYFVYDAVLNRRRTRCSTPLTTCAPLDADEVLDRAARPAR